MFFLKKLIKINIHKNKLIQTYLQLIEHILWVKLLDLYDLGCRKFGVGGLASIG